MATVKIFKKKVLWDGLSLICVMERYLNTNNIALELYDEEGEFYKCVTLDARQSLPKANNAVIYNEKDCAGVLNALTKVDMVKTVGKIDIKLMMRDLVVVNTRQFKEIEEDLFLEFAKSESANLDELTDNGEEVVEEKEARVIEVSNDEVPVVKEIKKATTNEDDGLSKIMEILDLDI